MTERRSSAPTRSAAVERHEHDARRTKSRQRSRPISSGASRPPRTRSRAPSPKAVVDRASGTPSPTLPGKTLHGDTGDVACDHYHRWESDLDLMAELGIPAYRLSLSWARLQPGGTGPLNPEGVSFYRNLLQGAAQRGITPYVTLYHWDLPQELQDAGGWPERETANRFGEYAPGGRRAGRPRRRTGSRSTSRSARRMLSYSWGMQAPGLTRHRPRGAGGAPPAAGPRARAAARSASGDPRPASASPT